ncbi:uncharacterized protein LOC122500782 [Leptopilina heterotoma]|uniref:uncharacterized protein LOC122500782 n=1 Tax=Leptopilina heterotoma TaxID=63436 RepID=UPI001CA8FB80|nr:uncharacterized protein LOC122500782 [Leptopilina heterotoma]
MVSKWTLQVLGIILFAFVGMMNYYKEYRGDEIVAVTNHSDMNVIPTFTSDRIQDIKERQKMVENINKTVDQLINKILNDENNFTHSVIEIVYLVKDSFNQNFSNVLQAIFDEANFTYGKANINQKVCINSTKDDLKAKFLNLIFDLDTCLQETKEIGDKIRVKLQLAHQKTLKVQEDLKEINTSCSSKIAKLDECISQKINYAQKDLNNLLEAVQMDSIAGEIIKSKISSESLKCSTKISSEMFQIANEFQGFFKNCIA